MQVRRRGPPARTCLRLSKLASGAAGTGLATCIEAKTGKRTALGFTGAAPLVDDNAAAADVTAGAALTAGAKAVVTPGAFGGWIEAPRRALDAEPGFCPPGAAITLQLKSRFSQNTFAGLRALGHQLRTVGPYSIGGVQPVLQSQHGTRLAGSDPRRMGYAIGY